ncbi:non-ribosomal peptide synthetase [Xenorhabdus bovienii]|uniref:non-ribosomal peptide synthetase n=1 Tax=Xenorhabdus bovienii TaxID=40576 RepID=UPI0008FF85F9
MYGITEITVHATYRELTESDITLGRGSLIGQPLPDLRAYILGTHGQPVPLGVTGEIHIAGAGVARGYLNRPELTAERFLADPFSSDPDARMYKTGDLGRWLPDGHLDYLGRNDFQVKLRGFRIELGEIEARLVQCPGVREAVVLARKDEPGQKRLVAYLRPQDGVELVPAELRQQLTQHLAEYMLPSAFMTLDAFPLTPNGKLDRQALPTPDSSAVVARGYEAPVGEVETALAQIWQNLLGLERVGRHDHFFELGGHSLMIVSLIERLRGLGWQLDVRSVFSVPVLLDMAQAILKSQSDADTFVVPPNRIPEGCTAITPDMLPLVSLSQAEIDAIADAIPGGVTHVQDIYPLAPLQEGILFHHLLQPNRDPYVISSLLSVENQTKLDAFIAALQAVIDRHDILRTSIHWIGLSQPVQVVHRHAPLPVNVLTFDDDSDVVASMQARMALSHQHMDLSHAPLIRLQVATEPYSSKLYVLFQLHHIIDDNLSLRCLLAETTAFLMGLGADLLPSVPYRNFVAYARQEGKTQEAEAFFRTLLADIDEVTAPFGLADVQGNGEHNAAARKVLDVELSQAIRKTARRFGTNPAILFHAAWALVVARTSGRDDIVFGTVLSGRMSGVDGSARALGMFINTLPLRLKLRGSSVDELVKMTNDACASLLLYEQTPLSLAQRCSGLGGMSLFSALLNFRHGNDKNTRTPSLDLFGLASLDSCERTNYPFEMSIDDDGEYFVLSAQTVNDIDPNRINTYLTRAIEQLISILIEAPDTPALDLDVLPEDERQQLLVDFNATQADFPQNALIHQLFEAQAAHHPDATAVVCGEHALSYGELNRRANRLAHHLIALGVRPDDRVAICLERSPEMVVSLLAILKAGGAYVPLDPAYPTERLVYMLDDAAPVALLTQTTWVNRLISPVPTVVLDAQEPALAAQPTDNPEPQTLGLTSRHLAYVIYTSGSTGLPKGVAIAHRNTVNFLIWAQRTFSPEELAHTLFATSLNFDLAVYECFAPLVSGGTVHLVPDALSLVTTEQPVSLINTVPSAIAHLIEVNAVPATARTVNLAGEALKPHVVEHLFAHSSVQDVCNLYGPSETTTYSTWIRMNRTEGFASHIGRPIANTQIYILNPHGQPVPLGVAGEIHIAGAGVARGYLNRPEQTAERFPADPFSPTPDGRMYKTGDLGRWRPDGNIEYLGRNDFQVKLRGFRIELGEIETQLMQCRGVREAVVLAREDEPGQKRLVAYVRPLDGVELVPAELRQQLAQHLAEYMLPSAFMTLKSFPLTPNGKLDRQVLPAPDSSAVVAHGYQAPIGAAETALAQIWQDLLGLDQVGRHDHFFELGGHSLLAVQLLNRMREQDMAVPLTTLFAHPTLCDLAIAIGERFAQSTSPFDANPVPLNPTGYLPPLFLVHETSGDPLVYSPLAALLPPELPVYALQALGIHTLEHPPASLEALAACHIQAIRRVQPQGPYRLAGWSIGGLIAYEMAQQFMSCGETVEFLGMIDSYNSINGLEITTDQPVDKEAKRIEIIIDSLRAQIGANDEQILEELHDLSDVNQILDRCIEHQWLPTSITREDILLRLYTSEIITQLGQDYIAPKSPLPIHLYTADEALNGEIWHGWRDIGGTDSTLHAIGGTHFSIMRPPSLNQIADSLTEHLLPAPPYDPRVIIQSGSRSVPPLFCMPGAGASASSLLGLALSFPQQLPVYSLQARGLGLTDEHNFPYVSVEGAARAYIQIIRQTQPHGPYHLLGHSFGGWIAFEIALQLQAEGEQVSDLILVDTDEPDPQGRTPKPVNRTETIMKLIEIYNMILDRPLPLTKQDFDDLAPDEQLQYLLRALVNAGLFPAKTPISLLQGVVRVMQANLNTCYTPRTRYEGLVHLISAEEGDVDETKTRETLWNTHAAQLNTMHVPGNHMTMLSSPQIEHFVTGLWQKLDYANNPRSAVWFGYVKPHGSGRTDK